jgi:hypothetical protein
MAPQNTTRIELLDLDDIEDNRSSSLAYTNYRTNGLNVDKLIRPNMSVPMQESGMRPMIRENMSGTGMAMPIRPNGMPNGMMPNGMMPNGMMPNGMMPNGMPQPSVHNLPPVVSLEPEEEKSVYERLKGTPSCLEIADHVSLCPICSRFYRTDSTIYVIAIVLLAIICILLLKRVLNI